MNPSLKASKKAMRWYTGLPIRTKLLLMIMLITSTAIVLVGGSFIAYEWYALKQQMVVNMSAQAEIIGNNCTAALSFSDPADAEEVLQSLNVKQSIICACLYQVNGDRFAHYHRDGDAHIDFPKAQSGEGHQFQRDRLILWRTISFNNQVLGHIYIRSDLSEVHSFLMQSVAAIGLMILISFFAAYFLAARFQQRISIPILSLAKTARDISESQDYSVRAVKYGEDELGQLTTAFNNMLTRIEDRDSALRESEERFRAVIENAVDSIYVHDSDGKIIDVNQAACDSTGYSRSELLSMHVGDLEERISDARDLADIARRVSIGRPLTIDGTHRRKDGSTFPVEVRLGQFELDGRRIILALVRDITERKKLEEQLQQAQKMEAVGQLAGGVAHDFNNLLQVILGYGEMAMESVGKETSAHEEINEIMNAAKRARTLVMQILAFGRRQMLSLQNLDLNKVIGDLEGMIQPAVGEHIMFNLRLEPELRPVKADRGQLEQVVMNLCINARDAMPEGGTITIHTSFVELDESFCEKNLWAQPGRYIVLNITDTGCGMDEETQQRVFEPFFTTKEEVRGTGLGLSMVYGIVRQHNGLIHVQSELDKGTSFEIYLPVAEHSEPAEAETKEKTFTEGAGTILLAEDNSAVRTMARRMLEQAGYVVLTAENGEEAIALFDAHADEISLALVDVVMPKVGGKPVYDHIQRSNRKIPVVFASGYSHDSFQAGFNLDDGMQLLQKPYIRDSLLGKLREVLNKAKTKDS